VNSSNGIYFDNFASSNGTITQIASLSNNTLNHNSRNGIYVDNSVRTAGTIDQTLTIANTTASYNSSSGIRLGNFGYGSTTAINQTVVISDSVIQHNSSHGVYVDNEFSSGAVLSQAITVDPTTITDNGEDGIRSTTSSPDNPGFTPSILNSTISNNGSQGVYLSGTGGSANSTRPSR
jgi:hypothetical protein